MRKTRRFHIGKVTAAILLSVTMICTMETPLLAAGNGQVQSTDQEAYKITKNLEQTYTGNVGETVTLEVATNDTENQAVYQWQIKEGGTETTKAEGTEAESTGEEPQGTAEGWKNLDGQNQPKLLITVSQEDLNGRLYRCVVTIGEQKLITGEARIGMPVAQPSQPTGGSQEPESTQPTGESQGPENTQPTGGSQGPENTQPTGGPQGPENTQPTGGPQGPENTQPTGEPQEPENTQPTGSPQGPESTQPTGGSSQSGGENSLNTNLAPVSTEKQPSANTLTVNSMEQGNTDGADGTALTEKKKAEDEKILDNQDDPDSQNKQNNQNNSEDLNQPTGQSNPEDQKDKDILPAPECILRTDTVIAVKAEEGLEYSIDSTSWTETGRFEKLIPDTEYTISARRMAQEGGQPGEAGEKLTVRTKKEALNPPEKPKVLEVTFSSITIETAEGQEYSIDKGETWQTQGSFTSLKPDTAYEILARFRETEEQMGSDSSQALTVTTEKEPLPVPESPQAPKLLGKTDTEIRIETQKGQEYSIDNGSTWQDGGSFSNLTPAKEYQIIGRVKATSENQAGKASSPLQVKTKAGPPSAPDKPVLAGRSQTELKIQTKTGLEYSIDGGAAWQASGTFGKLKADTAYSIIARVKETEDAVAGKQSQALEVKTLREPWVPDMKENKVTGVKGDPYALGETVKFQAVGAGMDNKEPIYGDVRFVPTHWECSGYSGKWTESPYKGSFKVEAQGTHYLKVYFERQMYNGESWKKEGSGCKITVTFHAGNVPKTGDEDQPVLWLSLMILAAGAAGLAAGRKKLNSSGMK
ncbi:MAG TPA: hypothetical protein H9809_07305 [Candidatus Blautia pullicola]|uniref:Uncharacterized protein n=1 Tax=Candidatus Blautia pullicola TaxID=2838498 RepID=A0A9D2JS76_9FIRM|nr:hypothetical protein [Candidatus Blautia pullicola]